MPSLLFPQHPPSTCCCACRPCLRLMRPACCEQRTHGREGRRDGRWWSQRQRREERLRTARHGSHRHTLADQQHARAGASTDTGAWGGQPGAQPALAASTPPLQHHRERRSSEAASLADTTDSMAEDTAGPAATAATPVDTDDGGGALSFTSSEVAAATPRWW